MAVEHSPGPWKVGYRALDVMAYNPKGGEFKICDIRGWGFLTGKGHGALGLPEDEAVVIQTANARLIAAAPDLLEACKEFVRKVDAGEAKSRRSYAQMKAAIAKATGGVASSLAPVKPESTQEAKT